MRIIFLVFVCALAFTARAAVVPLLAPDALVVVGDTAPAVERAAAERLAAALRAAGGPADNLRLAEAVNADLELAARHHLLVVGTEASNRVLARLPGHWALDRDRYYAAHPAVHPYEPTTGYYLAGYGVFTRGDVGYVECDRNPYWHYATNLVGTNPKGGPLPYRQLIRLCGNTAAGAAVAVDAFLQRQILTGPSVTALPGALSLWTLDTAHLALPRDVPAWLHAADVAGGDRALRFAGWHLADSMLYAGLHQICGRPARKIWRAKYLTEQGWNYPFTVTIDPAHPMTRSPLFEATLARRASDNEWLVAQFASPTEAAQARDAIERALSAKKESHAPWSDAPAGGIAWRRSKFGVHLAVIGDCLAIESFHDTHDALALTLVRP
jgi:hypothetical protein